MYSGSIANSLGTAKSLEPAIVEIEADYARRFGRRSRRENGLARRRADAFDPW